ncbi:hypothetical protein [Parafrankia discariae]|uniref:hypothetical protein n=1 Tax=Parafrankia discariae TaxID=365528 RepID=UPI001E317FB2|nr:hypothetical protein [Parafrankia discariae]
MSAVGTADMNDSLHPNDTGYQKMGDAFYRTISDVLRYDAFRVAQAGFADAGGSATGGAGGTTNPTAGSVEGWNYEGKIVSGVGRPATRCGSPTSTVTTGTTTSSPTATGGSGPG